MRVKMLVMDVDGTMTDGKIYMSLQGESFKRFDIKDGYGIHDLLPKAGIVPVIITGRESQIVINRSRELGIEQVYQGCRDKPSVLKEAAGLLGLAPDDSGVYQEVAYIGDDFNDMACMKICGITACPADAADGIKEQVDVVLTRNGGDGAVREFIEWLCAAQRQIRQEGPEDEVQIM